jgi:hypothetical protein
MGNKMNKQVDVYNLKVFHAACKKSWAGGAWLVCAAVAMLTLITVPVKANEQSNPNEVGRVTLVIGQASAQNKKGDRRPLKRGDAVYVDDTIETLAGGHVHLRFVDEGTVSLRPDSRLSIELYHYDEQQPKNSAIRFNLEAGVVRSISGKATQAAHDRFRLNTPITAIGVLGTDFVVRAEPEKMWAGVYSGAIAISPLSEQCPVNGLGACGGATRLSETMGSVMIEFSGRREKEKIVPLDPAILSKAGQPDSDNQDQSRDSPSATPGRLTADEIKGTDVAAGLGIAQQSVQQPSPFSWGRWSGQWAGDAMSQPYAVAKEGRVVTVGSKYFALFRAPSALTELEPRTGSYDFNLTRGQVYFVGNGASWQSQQATLARLDAASLRIDFAQRQFSTHLEMSHPQAGSAALDLAGAIQNNGLFAAQNPGGKAAGALSMDGAYAGMLFERGVQFGTFHGITDWAK